MKKEEKEIIAKDILEELRKRYVVTSENFDHLDNKLLYLFLFSVTIFGLFQRFVLISELLGSLLSLILIAILRQEYVMVCKT